MASSTLRPRLQIQPPRLQWAPASHLPFPACWTKPAALSGASQVLCCPQPSSHPSKVSPTYTLCSPSKFSSSNLCCPKVCPSILLVCVGTFVCVCVVLVRAQSLQSCPTLCNLLDYSPPYSSVHRDFLGKNTAVGSHALLQGYLRSPAFAGGFFTTSTTWEASVSVCVYTHKYIYTVYIGHIGF